MTRITYTGKQYVLTIPKDLMRIMGWDKDTEVVISKYPGKDVEFIDKIKRSD